jgi:hypothetical protein
MTLITSAIGLFYVLAAALVLHRAYAEGYLDQSRLDQTRQLLMTLSACLYGAAGLALLMRSAIALWLFAGGLGLQGVAYILLSGGKGAGQDDGRQSAQAWTAGIVSAAAIAFSAYALREGVLT